MILPNYLSGCARTLASPSSYLRAKARLCATPWQDVYAIAQQHQISEKAVWDTLSNAARAAAGRPAAQVETGGLGSDTDPGVTGGYGETGFGSLGAEPPEAIPEEPGQ